MEKLKKYDKKNNYSYTYGAFVTIELLHNKPKEAIEIIISKSFDNQVILNEINEICKNNSIKIIYDDTLIARICNKENVYIIGVFSKFDMQISKNNSHIVLNNPSDSGNLGTIMRTALAFNIKDIAIIEPCVDYFSTSTVRASMGAIFSLNIERFSSFEQYSINHKTHDKILFMLDGSIPLTSYDIEQEKAYSLVFGNEASGLPLHFKDFGTSVYIAHEQTVDSLNLSIAVGIGLNFVYSK